MSRTHKFALLSLFILPACASSLTAWQATGGSRADGSIRLSYEYKEGLRKTVTDPAQATRLAQQRCAAWGYQGAEAFGGETRTCNVRVLGMCDTWTVTREYQCLGALEK